MMGFQPKNITIDAIDERIAGTTHPRGTFCHCFQHRLKVSLRTGDHPQDVAGRSELFQRFVALAP
jgi:hypothetical protein